MKAASREPYDPTTDPEDTGRQVADISAAPTAALLTTMGHTCAAKPSIPSHNRIGHCYPARPSLSCLRSLK